MLETGREYEIYIEVYDTDSHKIYPSDVSPAWSVFFVFVLHPCKFFGCFRGCVNVPCNDLCYCYCSVSCFMHET